MASISLSSQWCTTILLLKKGKLFLKQKIKVLYSKHQMWNWLSSFTQLNMQAFWSPKAVSLILLYPAWHHHIGESVTPGTVCTGSCMFQLQCSVFLSSSHLCHLFIRRSQQNRYWNNFTFFFLEFRIAFFWCEFRWAQIYGQLRCDVIGEIYAILWKDTITNRGSANLTLYSAKLNMFRASLLGASESQWHRVIPYLQRMLHCPSPDIMQCTH